MLVRVRRGLSVKPLVEGTASGVLCGGCLSILTASLGTAYELETEGRILFLEDVSAKPYQIDRMLMQLKFAGKLDGVRGIIFGEMLDCVQPGGQQYSLQEIVARIVAEPRRSRRLRSSFRPCGARQRDVAFRGRRSS